MLKKVVTLSVSDTVLKLSLSNEASNLRLWHEVSTMHMPNRGSTRTLSKNVSDATGKPANDRARTGSACL